MTKDGPGHVMYENLLPVLFTCRSECMGWIKSRYGYIATRPDLRRDPFFWRMPRPVRVKIVVEAR